MSDDTELVPRWLQVTFAILRAAPWTELKSALACVGFISTGLWLVIASAWHITVDLGQLEAWLAFLAGAWGIASVGQGWKQAVAGKVAAAASTSPAVKP